MVTRTESTPGQFPLGHATGEGWEPIVDECITQLGDTAGCELGFVYATDDLADDLPAIIDRLRETTGIAHWVGSIGIGVAATGQEYTLMPALAVMGVPLTADQFQTFAPLQRDVDSFLKTSRDWLSSAGQPLVVVHGDPRNTVMPDLVEALAMALPGGRIAGGLASAREKPLQVVEEVAEGGLSGVMLHEDVPVLTAMTQGCTPISEPHRVTEGEGNVIGELDERPALDVFKEDIGEILSRDLNKVAGFIFAAIPMAGGDPTQDYMVRNLVGIDLGQKLVAVGDEIRVGDSIMFARRDAESARTDLKRMLEDVKKRLDGRVPRGGLYFSCLGRGEQLFGTPSGELAMVQEELGDVPLVGFFANGEISGQHLYGYTGVLTLFI